MRAYARALRRGRGAVGGHRARPRPRLRALSRTSRPAIRATRCKELEERGYPQEVIDAVAGHADFLGVPRETQMAKTLYAVDELSGFVTACALVRPTGIEGMKPKSVRKKLKQPSFAAAVDRDQVQRGGRGARRRHGRAHRRRDRRAGRAGRRARPRAARRRVGRVRRGWKILIGIAGRRWRCCWRSTRSRSTARRRPPRSTVEGGEILELTGGDVQVLGPRANRQRGGRRSCSSTATPARSLVGRAGRRCCDATTA